MKIFAISLNGSTAIPTTEFVATLPDFVAASFGKLVLRLNIVGIMNGMRGQIVPSQKRQEPVASYRTPPPFMSLFITHNKQHGATISPTTKQIPFESFVIMSMAKSHTGR